MQLASYSDRFLAGITDAILSGLLVSLSILPLNMILVFLILGASTVQECADIYPYDPGLCSTSLDVNWFLVTILIFMMIFIAIAVLLYYFVFRPAKHNGQTFAKGWFKIRVVNLDETTSSMQTLFVRYFSWQLIMMFISVFVYITMFFDENRRALYDMIAKTKVVKVETEVNINQNQ